MDRAWLIGSVLQLMWKELHNQVELMLALMVAVGEQVAIDPGSWCLAAELFFGSGAPVSRLAEGCESTHQVFSDCQSPLFDSRLFEVARARLRDAIDAFERRRRLEANRRAGKPHAPTAPGAGKQHEAKGRGRGRVCGRGPAIRGRGSQETP